MMGRYETVRLEKNISEKVTSERLYKIHYSMIDKSLMLFLKGKLNRVSIYFTLKSMAI